MKNKDRYHCFTELQQENNEGIDYTITIVKRDSNIVVIAPHGGWIECCTAEIATAIAGDDFSLYCFEALHTKNNLHITSTRFDEPKCLSLVSEHKLAVSIHVCYDWEACIYIGGRNKHLKEKLMENFSNASVSAMTAKENNLYSGIDKNNICNLCISGRGLQLEITLGLAHQMVKIPNHDTKYQETTPIFDDFVHVVREVLLAA